MPEVKKYNRKISLYVQIESLIRNRILTGQLEPGDKLPKEDDLIKQFGVSRITVRKAMSNLEWEGLVVRKPPKGTFVAEKIPTVKKFVIKNTIQNILEDAKRYKVKVVSINNMKVGETRNARDLRNFLNLKNDDEVCVIKRLRYLKGVPVCFLENFLPVEIGKQLTKTELSRSMLLEAVKKKIGRVVDRGEMYILATPAEPDIAELMGTQVFEPLILRNIYYWFPDNVPFEMVMYFMRPDYFKYKADMVVANAY